MYNGTAINLREYTSTESFSHLPLTFFHYVERGLHKRFTVLRTCICFRMCLPPDPIQCHFIWKKPTWNSTTILMNFHDDLHPPDPNQRKICKKFWTESFSHLPLGRTGHARKWIRFDDIDWGQGERMNKTLSPTARS